MTKIFGYSLFSSHKSNYMKYKSYASGNTVYAFCEGSSSGHSTIFFAIGI